ncbi:hypothetical protein C8R46DRAFT_1241434 [Mycena filopes]|nr:hypothetical protein C8R46DRAFT_1241434 [Mycena filopes]
MSIEAAVFATRYVSAVGVTALLYDHVLTSGDELWLIWLNPAAGLDHRAIFIFNRYVTAAVSIYAAYMLSGGSFNVTDEVFLWVLAVTTTLFTSLSNFVLAMRVYILWDRRERIKWVLLYTFGAALAISLVFSVITVLQIQGSAVYNVLIHMCGVTQKPWALAVVLGVWVLFDFLIIVLAVCNALEVPHHTQTDVVIALEHDGARMFLGLLLLRIANFVVAILAHPTYCFVTFTVLWAMCSIVTSRLQLGVERLRFTRPAPVHFLTF